MRTEQRYCDICGELMENNFGSRLTLRTTARLPEWDEAEFKPEDLCAKCGKAIYDFICTLKKK